MRRALTLLLAVVAACTTNPQTVAPTATPAPSPPPVATLRVLVTDPDGAAVGAAQVCASTTRLEERCANAAAAGTVAMSLSRSLIFVRVTGPVGGGKYVSEQRTVDLSQGDASLWVELAPQHRITGTVRDVGGTAIADADVCAHPASGETPACKRTRPDGTFAIDVRAGVYRLQVSGPAGGRLVPEWAVDHVSEDTATVYDLRTADVSGIDLALAHGVVLRGTITAGGRTVEDAQVCIKPYEAPLPWDCERTDKEGRYSALRVPGQYWIWVVPPADVLVAPQWYPSGFRGVDAQPLGLIEDTTMDYTLRTQPVRLLTGTVRAPWGSPVAGVLVCADTAFTTGRICRETASTGRYTIALRPETYIVSVIAPPETGFISEYWSEKRTWADADEVSLVAGDRSLDLILRTGSTVSGVVRDKRGIPVASATLDFWDDGGIAAAVATDVGGRFAAVMLPGHYRMQVFPSFVGDLLQRDMEIDVPTGDDLEIVLDDVSLP